MRVYLREEKMMKKLFVLSMGLMLLFLLVSTSSYAATVVSISPSVSTVSVGQTFSVDVIVQNITDLYGFQFDIGFNPSIIKADSVIEGSFLSDYGTTLSPIAYTLWDPGTIDNTAGSISFTNNLLLGNIGTDPGASGSGVLATINFQALGPGIGSLNILNAQFVDSTFLDPIAVTYQAGNVNISPNTAVPEPSTVLLLSGGLMAMALIARRKR
jgi:hypothetical protein